MLRCLSLLPGFLFFFKQFNRIAVGIVEKAIPYILEVTRLRFDPYPFFNQLLISFIYTLYQERDVVNGAWCRLGRRGFGAPYQFNGCAANVNKNNVDIIPAFDNGKSQSFGVKFFQGRHVLGEDGDVVWVDFRFMVPSFPLQNADGEIMMNCICSQRYASTSCPL